MLSLGQGKERHLSHSQVAGLHTIEVIKHVHFQMLHVRQGDGKRKEGRTEGGTGREEKISGQEGGIRCALLHSVVFDYMHIRESWRWESGYEATHRTSSNP